jgi:hypothetical protein
MNPKLKLGIVLFVLGFLGILSILTATLPLPEELAALPPALVNVLILINPTILLLVAVAVGTWLYDKVGFKVPVISSLLNIEPIDTKKVFVQQLKYGVSLGLLAGAAIMLVVKIYGFFIADELKMIDNQMELTLLARFMYGGITEELLLRFGLMTFLVWIIFKLTKKLNSTVYWIAIALSTLLFALGHFPVVFLAISEPSFTLLSYILIGNSIAGLVFGWLYWKKGLEAAIIAHAFAHVAMVTIGLF